MLLLLVVSPLASARLGRRLRQRLVSRLEVYLSAILTQALLVPLTALLDWKCRCVGFGLLLGRSGWLELLAWTFALIVGGAALWGWFLWRSRHETDDVHLTYWLLPRSRQERRVFAVVALAAGFGEEYVIRGFLLNVSARWLGSLLGGYVLATVLFGAAHLYQGRRSAVRAGLIGALLGLPVVVARALLPAMVAHAAIDLIAARWGLPLLARWSRSAA